MRIAVFLGPTMPVGDAAEILDAVYLPPAAQGDLYMAVQGGAEVIGVIDGLFQGVPSVWHKEILWAISRGVKVCGSSSMGALRAAELCDFGMQGIGRIFAAYRSGEITDDDEVAVVHGPREAGYRTATVPLVNMRATLDLALKQEVIDCDTHRLLIETAASLFYRFRSYPALLEACRARFERTNLEKIRLWLRDNSVDQKRADAIDLLHHLRQSGGTPQRVTHRFQPTRAWEEMLAEIRSLEERITMPLLPETQNRLLNEVRLVPQLYRQIVGNLGRVTSDPALWSDLPAALIDVLQTSGRYDQLAARADEKQHILIDRYGALPFFSDAMMTPAEVVGWYFDTCCKSAVPTNLDAYAHELGLATEGELYSLLLHELLYIQARDEQDLNGTIS